MTVKKTKARPQAVATRLEPNEDQPLLLDNGSIRDHVEDLEAPHQSSSQANQPILEAPDEATWTPPAGFMWMEIAIMTNVFLYGFDGTITASTYAVISSEFGAANKASWLTTSYLITSAAFQPLYGRVSDIFGRRMCFFISSVAFAIGCLGCGLAPTILTLICMRALAGIGGAGLMTMATIINSDLIPFRKRGMYQAMQNGIVGFGAICGAAFGGSIADTIGWRWCFIAQVPCAMVALVFGAKVLTNPPGIVSSVNSGLNLVWKRVDFRGAVLLVSAISLQLLGLSLGGNELPWSSPWVIGLVVTSFGLLGLFLHVEATTSAMPIVPLRLFKGTLPVLVQTANLLAGAAAYAYLFMLPLFFQAVLLEPATKAGARLAIPSLAGPLGGLVAGVVMSRWGKLVPLVRVGAFFMLLGNTLTATLAFSDSSWKYFAYIFPANFGQGIIYPSILFTSLASFEHADHAVSASTVYLVRSLGTMWGVSITSAILQTTLSIRLPEALGDVPNKWKIIEDIRHSVDALHSLPPEIRLKVQHVYYDGIRYSFIASASATALVLIVALLASSTALRKTH
ncbi:major facilitator superfamily transporter [Beauveria brongniartii RCEF 3172]|uniref:Major facilitator superfamily transporter n=1 Tax=Beauveria brongniartii RCEF 3172 TaxID=1081107 RepID=A0A167FII3_9HYPO|nr:major facilitator superfamily transporter [Beauveria brongniartii RCEF 3172]